MSQMTKEFAENLLERVKAGKHINTTVWEEQQLIAGWLAWHEQIAVPRLKALAARQMEAVGSPLPQGGEPR